MTSSTVGTAVLGAGVTGLAAGRASGGTVYEAEPSPGGICSSYYMRPGGVERLSRPPADGCAYRFEVGGGHWIFGGSADALELIESLAPTRRYRRRAGVHFASSGTLVPYPVQDHLDALGPDVASAAARDLAVAGDEAVGAEVRTMADWLLATFGPALCERFFAPFHDRYTAGLYRRIAPQDPYKTPSVAPRSGGGTGYNHEFRYPVDGLDHLARAMAEPVDVRYRHRVTAIDTTARRLHFGDGRDAGYDRLLSTLPLGVTVRLAGVDVASTPDPYTSVLVLNIGARRTVSCPTEHWLYEPEAASGFHRVGYYSNVDDSFLPRGAASADLPDRVALYVERSYPGGDRPSPSEVRRYTEDVVRELQGLGEVEVVDPSWVEVAYTWSWPSSRWRTEALDALADAGVEQVGRYARWHFQGIAESISDGLAAGAATDAERR